MSKIFFCYDQDDTFFVDRLLADLALNGHETWLEQNEIEAGEGWRTSTTRAIRTCRAFILVLSSHSILAKSVTRELSIADAHRRYIIPVLLDQTEIPPEMEYTLADLQLINFGDIDYDEGLRRLLAALDHAEEAPAALQIQEKTSAVNRLAVVSFVSGLLGFTLLPGIAIPVALITGYKARNQIHNSTMDEKSLRFAQAGIALGWLGLIVGILILCYLIEAIDWMVY